MSGRAHSFVPYIHQSAEGGFPHLISSRERLIQTPASTLLCRDIGRSEKIKDENEPITASHAQGPHFAFCDLLSAIYQLQSGAATQVKLQ